MEEKQANKMISKLIKEGSKAKIYNGYSGRGMFGRETFGVQTEECFEPSTGISRDNLGLDYIYY